jgi:hypothetical protein
MELLVIALDTWPGFERKHKSSCAVIEEVLELGLKGTSAAIRTSAVRCFLLYLARFPERESAATDALDARSLKMLNASRGMAKRAPLRARASVCPAPVGVRVRVLLPLRRLAWHETNNNHEKRKMSWVTRNKHQPRNTRLLLLLLLFFFPFLFLFVMDVRRTCLVALPTCACGCLHLHARV